MLRQQIEARLRGVMDPETGRDLVAMGLIYAIHVADGRAEVEMTATTPGCPLAEMLRQGVEAAVQEVDGVTAARARLVWDPPWTPDRMAP